jgi:Spy/CpxP family protein refolding chaperone
MNSVTTNHAGTKAGQFARRAVRAVLAGALVLGASGAAFAQQYGEHQYGEHHDEPSQQSARGERGARFQLPPQDRDARNDARAYEEQRRMQQQYQQDQRESRRGSGRMTADERRDLRRQINEAGIDLYPPRR